MPVISCTSCPTKFKVSDEMAGKAVKCPKCKGVVRVPGAAAAVGADKPAAAAAAKPAAPAKPPADGMISAACACGKKIQVREALAGKAVKCPACAKPVKVPATAPAANTLDDEDWGNVNGDAAPAPPSRKGKAPPLHDDEDDTPKTKAKGKKEDDEGEWLDVDEAAAPDKDEEDDEDETPSKSPGGWGQELLKKEKVPKEMQDELRQEMTKNESIEWISRPRQDILLHRAKMQAIIFGSIFGTVGLAALIATVICLLKAVWIGVAIGAVFGLTFSGIAIFMITQPARVRKHEAVRPCYVMTQRRLLVHSGKGSNVRVSVGSSDVREHKAPPTGVNSYMGLDLIGLTRAEAGEKFKGAGDLCFSTDIWDYPASPDMEALDKVVAIEKRIREKLIHPVIDKLLRGEVFLKKGTGARKGGDDGEDVKQDSNIKDYASDDDIDEDDPNIKDAPNRAAGLVAQFAKELRKVDEELRDEVDAELTAGEKVLWIGEPEASVKGRGLLGAMMGGATRHEPKYTFYAITNRRVMLGIAKQAPVSYYPTGLMSTSVEQDKRIEKGGGIIFRQVKKTITTEDKKTGKVLKTRVEMHYFGILRIRHYEKVAQLLYETLVRPIKFER
jgi:hypothetical protein